MISPTSKPAAWPSTRARKISTIGENLDGDRVLDAEGYLLGNWGRGYLLDALLGQIARAG